jgi:hypothetical protein
MKNGCLRGFVICALIAAVPSAVFFWAAYESGESPGVGGTFAAASVVGVISFVAFLAMAMCVCSETYSHDRDTIFTSDEESMERRGRHQVLADEAMMERARELATLLPFARKILKEKG